MEYKRPAAVLFSLFLLGAGARSDVLSMLSYHQVPDADGIYYAGPEVSAPRMLQTVMAPYPSSVPKKDLQGQTVMAMVIGVDGVPAHIQLLHSHGELFDEGAVAAVQQSRFEPGRLNGKPVPVWIDVRVVFYADGGKAIPQVVIAERDLAAPSPASFENKRHQPLSWTEPVPIHTVDADFWDPFVAHPYVQVALVTVEVGADGLPKAVRVRRGLSSGMDKKAVAAVWHYRFLPATKKGQPIESTTDVQVSFATF